VRRQLTLKDPFLEGEDINLVQVALGLKGDAVDGIFGSDTASAVEEWKWRVGYPKDRINSRLGLIGLAWLFGEEPLPGHFARNAKARKGKPYGAVQGIVRPLASPPGTRSEFSLVDAEGAADRNGVRHHAGKDWFAAGRSPLRAPVDGTVVEAKVRPRTTGQVFGGTVKIEAARGKKVWVFRHCNPVAGLRVGQKVKAGQVVAKVTPWRDGASHAHIELWKDRNADYRFERMEDPMRYLKVFR
jgi:murein DD-endopeptidase MepM/ murein hydrolase activator NlpD